VGRLSFHVRHEVKPDRVWGVLEAISEGFEYDHITQANRQLSRLRQLGLVSTNSHPVLTATGEQIYQLGRTKPDVLREVFHFLHYKQWDPQEPVGSSMFYTYRAYCNLLYGKGALELTHEKREEITAELNGKISEEYRDYSNEFTKGAVSLSVNSLRGIEHWLENLSPSILEQGEFSLRHFCVAEPFILALGHVTERFGMELNIDQLMTPEKRRAICQICFLDENDFDKTLDWVLPAYPTIVQPGTSAGSYGRFIRLLKLPSVEDVIE
jgi:hypothetical protein